MKPEEKERIEKEAEQNADSFDRRGTSVHHGYRVGYIAGATAEHERIKDSGLETNLYIEMLRDQVKQERNKALDEAIELIPKQWNAYATLRDIITTLESLKRAAGVIDNPEFGNGIDDMYYIK